MLHKDGNIGSWIDEQLASIAKLSARSIGFQSMPGSYDVFLQSLRENRDAKRLNQNILPKCRVPDLAAFVVFVVSTNTEEALLRITKERGQHFKTEMRAAGRNGAPSRRILKRAERAFDIRRRGLAEYCFPVLIVRAYLHYKSGIKPSFRELAALLKAGLDSSKAAFGGAIDSDLLRRNVDNYERKHALIPGEISIDVIENRHKQL